MKNKEIRLPDNYIHRPATIEDVEKAVDLFNLCSRERLGLEEFSFAETRSEWQTPGFNLKTDTILVIAPDDVIVGYFEVWDLDPHVRVHCWGQIHPEYENKGLGQFMIKWAETRAQKALAKAPANARVVLHAHISRLDTHLAELLDNGGYNLIRHFSLMVIEFDGAIPPPKWASGVTVRTMEVGVDERPMALAIREAFRDHWGHIDTPFERDLERWKHFMKTNEYFDPKLCFLAVEDHKIAGISLCLRRTPEDPRKGWIDVLGVRPEWRKRGIGLALLHHSFRELYKRGKKSAGLGVDAESLTGATRLYRRAGMRPEPARQYDLYEKELRPGVDLSTQKIND